MSRFSPAIGGVFRESLLFCRKLKIKVKIVSVVWTGGLCHEHQGRSPPWMADLDDEDVSFIKRFVLASGSLKEIASEYGVSYPTMRLRLDRLIQKIRVSDATEADPYVALIKRLAADERIDFTAAKVLIKEYRKQGKGGV